MDETTKSNNIRAFFKNKCVLITGATGFVGCFLLLRLLQTCSVDKVYIVIRGKRGKGYLERYQNFINSEIFSYLPNKKLIDKVIPLMGDISLPQLGLSSEDYETLIEKVHVIFHSAASVRFNESLKTATLLHVYGTQNILKMAKKMVHLKSLVHVSSISTFYSEEVVKEEVQEFPFFPTAFLKVISDMDTQEADKITPSLLGKYPNTYTFTKTMAEVLIREEGKGIPVAIARPPFVFPAFRVPFSGWFDMVQTLPSLITFYSSGILRTTGFGPKVQSEYIPADMLANSLLAMAWYMSDVSADQLMTFNMCSLENPITVEEVSQIASEVGQKYPSIKTLRPPKGSITYDQSAIEYNLRKLISHTFFAYFVDFILFLVGKKPLLTKLTKQVNESLTVAVDQFYKKSLNVEMKNLSLLLKEVPIEEKDIFYFDISAIDWRQLITDHHMRFRRHVLKEPDESIPAAVKRLKRVTYFYGVFKICFWLLSGLTLWTVSRLTLDLLYRNVAYNQINGELN